MDDINENNEDNLPGEDAQAVHEPEQSEADGNALVGLQDKLAEAQANAAENLEGWQRAQAEFSNYKKRISRDQEQLGAEARGRVIKRYLEIVDDLERALKNKPDEGVGAEWAQGIELVYRKLQSYLESEGLTRTHPLGQLFDANLHEAVTEEKSDEHKSGTIIEVLRPGYMLGERVLRPASVKVAK
jgi:molecular chaperone GrpE